MRVVVAGGGTGGHLYPGLAIARALVQLEPTVAPLFVGALRGIEREVLPGTEFPHVLLDLHPLYRTRVWKNWLTVRGLAGAWRRIDQITRAERPAIVIGTGGYAAGAMLGYAVTHRIPMVIQEANSYPGVTVRLFSRYARAIYLGFPEAAAHLHKGPGAEIVDTGNPIQPPPSPRPARADARRSFQFPATVRRVLLAFGGSQGARALNEAVSGWVSRGLPDELGIIWGTGSASFEAYRHHENDRVRVRAYLSPIEEAYAACDLALTRAGAMTTAELCAWGIPSILVPLPTAAADHQTANARSLERAGAAMHLSQSELTHERLDLLVRELLQDPARLQRLSEAAAGRGRPDAAQTIARRVLTLIQLKDLRS